MGLSIEIQNVLALRHHDFSEYALAEAECVPQDIVVGGVHEFLKDGYRIYPLDKHVPLAITHGKQQFAKVCGLVTIDCLCIDTDPLGYVKTSGMYRISQVFDEEESNKWLQFLHPKGQPHEN